MLPPKLNVGTRYCIIGECIRCLLWAESLHSSVGVCVLCVRRKRSGKPPGADSRHRAPNAKSTATPQRTAILSLVTLVVCDGGVTGIGVGAVPLVVLVVLCCRFLLFLLLLPHRRPWVWASGSWAVGCAAGPRVPHVGGWGWFLCVHTPCVG